MPKRTLFIILAGLFLLGSLNSVLAAPPREAQPREAQPREAQPREAQPRIDRGIDIRPEAEFRITDNPRIEEFSINPTTIIQGGQITFRWRVEPGPGGSPVNRIRVTYGSTEVFISSDGSGSFVDSRTSTRLRPGSYDFVITATNERGNSSNRGINIQIKADEPVIRTFTVAPEVVVAGEQARVSWYVDRGGGSPIREVRLRNIPGHADVIVPSSGDSSSGERTFTIPSHMRRSTQSVTLLAVGRTISMRTVGFEVLPRDASVRPDLTVSINSIGAPQLQSDDSDRDPRTGQIIEHPDTPIQVTIPFNITVRNIGTALARPVIVNVESSARILGGFSFEVPGSRTVGSPYFDESLIEGGSRTFSGNLKSGINTLSEYRRLEGTEIRFRALVDPGLGGHPTVTESNEGNNYSEWSRAVVLPRAVTIRPLPDFTVGIHTLERNPTGGRHETYESWRIRFQISNQGTGSGPRNVKWEVSLYPSIFRDREWDMICTSYTGAIIHPGRSDLYGIDDFNIPSTVTKIRVRVDWENEITESNEDNNWDERDIVRR